MKSAPSISFDYKPSFSIALLTGLLTGMAVSSAFLVDFSLLLRVLVAVTALAYGVWSLQYFWQPLFQRIAYNGSGWLLVDKQGCEHAARLVQYAILGDLLSLRFAIEQKSYFVALIFVDNLDKDRRRRVKLLLAREAKQLKRRPDELLL